MDSILYIIKAFLSISTAYLLSKHNTLLKLDTISIFFGLMLTLEPVNLTGIRFGLNQIYASFIGGAASALIIYFLGINLISTALAVSFTLYICLKINWREASVVAIFTSIYMTQYVQKDILGNPSILLTFKLRMAAISIGVAIAILYNFLFSLISYKSMFKKRIMYLLKAINNNFIDSINAIDSNDINKIKSVIIKLPYTFNNIDWVNSHLEDKKKEHFTNYKINSDNFSLILENLRAITHLNYDILYSFITDWPIDDTKSLNFYTKSLFKSSDNLKILYNNLKSSKIEEIQYDKYELINNRIEQDLNNINKLINSISREIELI